jgi:hypothetical protein
MTKQYIVTDGFETLYYSDKAMTVLHREDGPAAVYANGDKEWHLNGERHREDGPAVEDTDGYKEWYIHGKLHREDGPAIEHSNGYKDWYIHGKRVREDGTPKVLLIRANL